MITFWDYEQGSDDWHAARLGLITASKVSEVLSKGVGRARYMRELAAEIITGQRSDFYTNAAMQWGTETEPQARAYHSMLTGVDIVETGFCTNSEYPGCGVSPDGLLCYDGLVEIKAPNTATHIEYVMAGKLPSRYKPQVQMQMMVTKREWCDFVSFDPRIQTDACIFIKRVERDDKYLQETMIPAINQFRAELAQMLKKLGVENEQ